MTQPPRQPGMAHRAADGSGSGSGGLCPVARTFARARAGADLAAVGRSAFTGWVGYRRFCGAKAGETMVVSAAAEAVGMTVVQIAKADGLRVIGIARGPQNARS
ncbi:hypothetical protein [Novosphingobium sp. Fuku2-ISO-50]|uniref:hypothetical protein n=1 Tax=Novosphingobium sp. Fuku2-ISO-50 TaxID=1739114 RepID=UPI000A4E36B8